MTGPGQVSATDDAIRIASADGERTGLVLGAAHGLQLAAAPTFALMALLTAAGADGAPDVLCAATQGGSSLTGMIPMYGLMSVFHAAPWLRLVKRTAPILR